MLRRLSSSSIARFVALGFVLALIETQREASADDPGGSGREIYLKACASCHGLQLEGQPNWRQRRPDGKMPAPPHDVSGHTWHHPDAVLFEITKFGLTRVVPGYQSDMPAFEGILSDNEIDLVLSYIQSTWPTEIKNKRRLMVK